MAVLILVRGLTGTGKSTLLNHLIDRNDLDINKLEIDDIKRRKYGTTKICNPKIDFQEAGRQAIELLKHGTNVVVEEAFCTKAHIQFFLTGANLNISDPKLLVIRLKCSMKTATNRKKNQLDLQTVREQYSRAVEDIENEIVFDTENDNIKEIADRIVKRIT